MLPGVGANLAKFAQNRQLQYLNAFLYTWYLQASAHWSFVGCGSHHPLNTPQAKIREFNSVECGALSTSQFLSISLSWNRFLSQAGESFNVWGWPRIAGNAVRERVKDSRKIHSSAMSRRWYLWTPPCWVPYNISVLALILRLNCNCPSDL